MKAIRLASNELRRFRRPLQRIALGFLVTIPLLYGALYLWSNWDPYGELDRIPVAVVNNDEPVTVDGDEVDAGGMFVDTLESEPTFDWVFTDSADAADGLRDGRYYMIITIPEDFSTDLASGAEGEPRRATVATRRDDGNGYIFGIMAETVQVQLKQQLDQAATTAYFEAVYGNLDALRSGLVDADDGASQLADGLSTAKDGSAELSSGLDDAADGSSSLVSGLGELEDGATQVADGADQVADGTQQLNDVVGPVVDTVVPLVPGVAESAVDVTTAVASLTELTSEGSDTIADRTSAVVDDLESFAADNPEVADDPAFQEIVSAAQSANDRAGEIASAVGDVNTAAQTLADDAQQLDDASSQIQDEISQAGQDIEDLADGAAQVSSGATELRDGISSARDGAVELDSGMSQLQDGVSRLDNGNTDLLDGAQQLDSGLDQMVGSIPEMSDEKRESDAQILGSPTRVTMTADHDAEVYGRGLAPFFFAIALWVFGIAAFVIMRAFSGRALVSRARASTVAIAAWLPIFGLCLAGGVVLFVVSWAALGLDPVNPWGTLGLVALAAAAFTAIEHLLRAAFGVVGTAIALVLLMLQLTSSAGIYPVETLPAPFRALHPFMPMTYLVDGFRVTMTGGNTDHLIRDVIVLAAFLVVALGWTVAVVATKRTWTVARLHPVLES